MTTEIVKGEKVMTTAMVKCYEEITTATVKGEKVMTAAAVKSIQVMTTRLLITTATVQWTKKKQ